MKARPDDIEVIMALGNVQRSRKKYEEAADDLLARRSS